MPQIHQAMISVMREVSAIEKDRKNTAQNYSFRGIDDVYNDLHAKLAKHGVFPVPKVISERSEERTTPKGTVMIYRVIHMSYSFTAEDGSSIEATTIGEGMDSGDKASNKAMSVAQKYAFIQVFCIPTKEDKDPEVVSDTDREGGVSPKRGTQDDFLANSGTQENRKDFSKNTIKKSTNPDMTPEKIKQIRDGFKRIGESAEEYGQVAFSEPIIDFWTPGNIRTAYEHVSSKIKAKAQASKQTANASDPQAQRIIEKSPAVPTLTAGCLAAQDYLQNVYDEVQDAKIRKLLSLCGNRLLYEQDGQLFEAYARAGKADLLEKAINERSKLDAVAP